MLQFNKLFDKLLINLLSYCKIHENCDNGSFQVIKELLDKSKKLFMSLPNLNNIDSEL